MAHYYKGDQPPPSRPPRAKARQQQQDTAWQQSAEPAWQPAAQPNWQSAPQTDWAQNAWQNDGVQHPSGTLPGWQQHSSGPLPGWQQHPSGPLPEWQHPIPPPKQSLITRWWFLAGIGALLVVGIAVIATAGGTPDTETTSGGATTDVGQSTADQPADDTAASVPAPPPASEAPIPEGALSDGGWTVESIQLDESLGNFSGTMRVVNTDTTTRTGFFTLTMLLDGAVVGTAIGVANDVEPGSTGTVQLLSSDPFVTGDLTYEFQTEF